MKSAFDMNAIIALSPILWTEVGYRLLQGWSGRVYSDQAIGKAIFHSSYSTFKTT